MDEARELLIQNCEAHALYVQTSYNYWIKYSVFTWKWWVLVAVLIIPWFIWWRIVDKQRFLEICCFGFLTINIILGADATGVALNLWIYPIRLASKFPHILPVDTTLLPIAYMMIYQYFSDWKSFIIASVFMATVFAFILEPLGVWFGVYELIAWKYYYSFPLYIFVSIFFKSVMETVKSIQNKNS